MCRILALRADEAFDGWDRRGVPHARQSHALLAGIKFIVTPLVTLLLFFIIDATGVTPPPPLMHYDRAGTVLSVGSFSKILAPGLRVGWVDAAPELGQLLINAKQAMDTCTNLPMQRLDQADLIYKSEDAKFEAVVDDLAERYEKGQPCLVGTVSVEKSELLSNLLRQHGVPHSVLNAKHHADEAKIVAMAGHRGAVTVATNMAGRGTDIKLGPGVIESKPSVVKDMDGNDVPVTELGGLHIVGSERHESRRIDRQLRGRAGRQGDPGASQFFLSLEDDLMRIFGSDRIAKLMDRLGAKEGEVLTHPLITRSIEQAQKRVELQNFQARKRLLEYDDVMNQQRGVVYSYRREILEGRDMSGPAKDELRGVFERIVEQYTPGDFIEDWDVDGLFAQVTQIYDPSFGPDEIDAEALVRTELAERATRAAVIAVGATLMALSADANRMAGLLVEATNRMGILAEIATRIAAEQSNISHVNVDSIVVKPRAQADAFRSHREPPP